MAMATATTTMVPDLSARPDVLPSERLMANGMAVPEIRPALRHISNWRNAITVLSLWFWVVLIVGGSVWLNTWWSYLIAFVLMGPMYARFAILMHESAHKLLFTNKRWNDWIGMWVIAYPAFTPVQLYRAGCTSPTTRKSSVRTSRTLPSTAPTRAPGPPCAGVSSATRWASRAGRTSCRWVKNTRAKGPFRPIGLSIFAVQAVLWAVSWLATGRWWIYLLLWWLPVDDPLAGQSPVAARIAEHGWYMERNKDRRATPHNVRQSLLAPVLSSCPANTGHFSTWPTTSTWACSGATSRPSTSSWSGWPCDDRHHLPELSGPSRALSSC